MGHFIWNHYYEQVYYLKKDIDIKDIKVLEDEVEFVKWIGIEEIFDLIKCKKFREGNINGLMDILSKYHKEYL